MLLIVPRSINFASILIVSGPTDLVSILDIRVLIEVLTRSEWGIFMVERL